MRGERGEGGRRREEGGGRREEGGGRREEGGGRREEGGGRREEGGGRRRGSRELNMIEVWNHRDSTTRGCAPQSSQMKCILCGKAIFKN